EVMGSVPVPQSHVASRDLMGKFRRKHVKENRRPWVLSSHHSYYHNVKELSYLETTPYLLLTEITGPPPNIIEDRYPSLGSNSRSKPTEGMACDSKISQELCASQG